MKLFLKTAGGIGNIRIRGAIDTQELPPALARRVRTVFAPERLDALARPGQMADGLQYEVDVVRGDRVRRLLIDESSAPDDLIDTLQDLVQEIVRRKKGR